MIWQCVLNDMLYHHVSQHLLVILCNLNVWYKKFEKQAEQMELSPPPTTFVLIPHYNFHTCACISYISGRSWIIPLSVHVRKYSAAFKVYGARCSFLFAWTLQKSRTVRKYMISTTLRRLKPKYNPRSPPQLAANMNHCMRGPCVQAYVVCTCRCMLIYMHRHPKNSL